MKVFERDGTTQSLERMTLIVLSMCFVAGASAAPWNPDRGDGTYQNPVLFADYSDPDVICVGQDFYLIASSINCVPGLPILHSRDLINWRIIGHVVDRLPPVFDSVRIGDGLYAPSLRYHDGWFWVFVGDPDRGIMMTRSVDPGGPWPPLKMVKEGKGLIDPCPLWDDHKAYLAHAFAKSRAGKNSIVVCQEMSPDGLQMIGAERIIIDGRNGELPTVEGPKLYKRGEWYYVFAPAGGVKFGWQVVARSRSPFGPYETKRVLEQGSTNINGPHQGAWVELKNGESWFLHFQDRGPYGRVVHLNPLKWNDDWPIIGEDFDGNGIGEPVEVYRKPNVADRNVEAPSTSDEFDETLGLQWQWQANPDANWSDLTSRPGWLRLQAIEPGVPDLTRIPNQLLQKFPAPSFTATTLVDLAPASEEAQAGLIVSGATCSSIMVRRTVDGINVERLESQRNSQVHVLTQAEIDGRDQQVWLRVVVQKNGQCAFSFSENGTEFTSLGPAFDAKPGMWIGAKIGVVCIGAKSHADFDWFRIE